MPRPAPGLVTEAEAAGFAIERTVVEAEGLCAGCREAGAMSVLLEATGLGVTLGGHRVLDGVGLVLRRGEIVTIVGPNGSGKTTLLRLLIGAERPDTGRIERAPGLRIGYVPQKLAVDRTLPLTVDGFLGLSGAAASARAAALDHVGIAGLGARQLAALSGGQFQRAMLAQALLRRPDLLVLDEAAQGLDQTGEARFYRLIEQLRAELGCGVLMVSHDLHVVMAASDRVICLNGHVCCEGTPTVGLGGAGVSGAVRGRDAGGAGALPARPRPRARPPRARPRR